MCLAEIQEHEDEDEQARDEKGNSIGARLRALECAAREVEVREAVRVVSVGAEECAQSLQMSQRGTREVDLAPAPPVAERVRLDAQ